MMKPRLGFTLVELMVSVSILSIGIVGVLRSFISMSSVLEISANRLEAARILEVRMDGIEEELVKDSEWEVQPEEEELILGNRAAEYTLEVSDFDLRPEEEEPEKEPIIITEAKMNLAWKEGQISKDAWFATYFQKKTKK